jgi:glycosyltransferase involved in cell wall biosynthesis
MNVLLIGVRGHGGEEVYSGLLRDRAPAGVEVRATFDFHESCAWGRSHGLAEILLNRCVHRFAPFNMGFRVLSVGSEVDLVHVHTHPTILVGRGRRPVVFSAGSSHYHYLRDYEHWSEDAIRRSYSRARPLYASLGVLDALLSHRSITLAYTFSSYARQVYIEMGVPESKIRVLYPGFDIPEPPPRAARDGVTFLFLGRAPRRKGGDDVLAAFERLRESLASARLLYVTDEPPAVSSAGVESLPLVAPADVGALYARADVFVNPTRAEGFGFTNAEAQGHGLPVISTRLNAIPEVVEEGRTGILVAPGDRAALHAAMRRLGEDAVLRREMRAAARERFQSRFSLGVFQGGLKALYEEALETARTSRA